LAPTITAEQPDLLPRSSLNLAGTFFIESSVLIINKTELILARILHYLTPPFFRYTALPLPSLEAGAGTGDRSPRRVRLTHELCHQAG
jgi:hypothetical protein